ncbi:MAG: Pyocin activator protein PrtN, partial [Bacteriophage sp.]
MSRTIKEAQQLTGITSQNIRYYEKQGLLTPERNALG